jgi:hypothetical protein
VPITTKDIPGGDKGTTKSSNNPDQLNTPKQDSPATKTTDVPKSELKAKKSSGLVKAKDTFASRTRTVIKGQLLSADDEIVKAKPGFFAPYESK